MSAFTEEQSRARAEGTELALLLKRAVQILPSELLRLNLRKCNFIKCREQIYRMTEPQEHMTRRKCGAVSFSGNS